MTIGPDPCALKSRAKPRVSGKSSHPIATNPKSAYVTPWGIGLHASQCPIRGGLEPPTFRWSLQDACDSKPMCPEKKVWLEYSVGFEEDIWAPSLRRGL